MNPSIPTKVGQAPTDSPRTLESNRRRLGSLFSTLAISQPIRPASGLSKAEGKRRAIEEEDFNPGQVTSTPTKGSGTPGGWLGWLAPSKQAEGSRMAYLRDQAGHSAKEDTQCGATDADEGVEAKLQIGDVAHINHLPDDILIDIILHLPPTLYQILNLSLVSKRFHLASQSPRIWSHLYHAYGFKIVPDLQERLEAVPNPPGRWSDTDFTAAPAPLSPILNSSTTYGSIPVHYPTLFRSRWTLKRIIHLQTPHPLPPHREVFTEHTDSVYCVRLYSPWVFTGSRDRSIRIWKLGDLSVTGRPTSSKSATKMVKKIEDAHEGSVLSLRFEMRKEGDGGVMITGSSDMTAVIWDVALKDDITVKKTGTLRGHTSGVLDVALSQTRIATSSKDNLVHVYDRGTLSLLLTLQAHQHPVNCLTVDPKNTADHQRVVSASGDGYWIIWDMLTGQELRRSGEKGVGLACVAWEADYLVVSDNGRNVKLYNPDTADLIFVMEGHRNLVRSVTIDSSSNIIVSAGYDHEIWMWDIRTGKPIRRIKDNHTSLIFGVTAARGQIISVSHDQSVQVMTYGRDLPYRGLLM